MNKLNTYEQVARIARHAAVGASSAQIADAIVRLEQIARRTRRLTDRIVSEGSAGSAPILLKAWQKRADAAASTLGLVATVGSMGYIGLVDPIQGIRIATFG